MCGAIWALDSGHFAFQKARGRDTNGDELVYFYKPNGTLCISIIFL